MPSHFVTFRRLQVNCSVAEYLIRDFPFGLMFMVSIEFFRSFSRLLSHRTVL